MTGISVADTITSVVPTNAVAGLVVAGFRVVGANHVNILLTNTTSAPISLMTSYTLSTTYVTGDTPPPPTVLLCHCDGAPGSTTFTDVSPKAHTLTATNATVTSTAMFGTGAANFTAGSNAAISTGNATDFQFGAGAFTIEAWCYFTSLPGGTQCPIAAQINSPRTTNNGWLFGINTAGMHFGWSTVGTDILFTPTASYVPPLTTWIHLAVDCDASSNLRLYVNGAVLMPATTLPIFASTLNATIGNYGDGLGPAFPGYLDEVRIVKGQAMYMGAFTPPTGPFPA